MQKEQIDLCKEVVGLFNKATFNVSGVELIQFANKLSLFSKWILTEEEKLKSALKPVEDKNKLEEVKNSPEIIAEKVKATRK